MALLLLPPIVVDVARRLRLRAPDWEYVADRWPENRRGATGWDDPSVAKIMRDHWVTYKRRMHSTGPLAFWPWDADTSDLRAHNIMVTFGYVLGRAAYGRENLSVLDWGGALGHYALAAKALLPEVILDFTVKDRPNICTLGKESTPGVTFISSDDECFARRHNLVMANNSFQYAEDWRDMARRLSDAADPWLFISCLPTVHRSPSFVAVQRPQRHGLKSDYLSWVLNRDEFLDHMKNLGARLEREFLSLGSTRYRGISELSESLGFLFRRP